uniref:CAAX prenyl protease 2/Lysostaphin resistance protein A-like domain-containing protein n=1 Tax=Tetradesmus obliquus TaxID=3088 RepID=A0A383W3W3_TETOB|eukprot:jgi/Sobl393_1/16660/SZX72357.1
MARCLCSSSRGSRALLGRASQPSRAPCHWLHRHGHIRVTPCLLSSLPNKFEQQLSEQQGSNGDIAVSSCPEQQQREDVCWPEPVPDENGSPLGLQASSERPQQQQQQQPAATAVPPPPAANSNSVASNSSSTELAEQQQQQQLDPEQQQQQSSAAAAAPQWPPDIPWGLGKVVQVMGLWLLAYLALGQLAVPALLSGLGVDQAALGPRGGALLNLSLDLGQVGITAAILAGCLGRYAPRQRGLFRVAWQGGRWLWVVAAGALAFPVVDWLANSSMVLLSGEAPGSVESTLAERDWLTCGAYVAVVSVCAPLWEELIFRGFLLPSLAARLARPAALLGSSLVFALCHFRAETFAPLLLLGLVFGAAYEQCSGNLAPPMALHSLWNAYVLGSMVLQMRSGLGPVGAGLAVVGCMQGGLLLAAALVYRPWQARRGRQQQQQQDQQQQQRSAQQGDAAPPPAADSTVLKPAVDSA